MDRGTTDPFITKRPRTLAMERPGTMSYIHLPIPGISSLQQQSIQGPDGRVSGTLDRMIEILSVAGVQDGRGRMSHSCP